MRFAMLADETPTTTAGQTRRHAHLGRLRDHQVFNSSDAQATADADDSVCQRATTQQTAKLNIYSKIHRATYCTDGDIRPGDVSDRSAPQRRRQARTV